MPARRFSEEEIQRILSEADSSTLPAAAFCRQHGISPSTLKRWQERYHHGPLVEGELVGEESIPEPEIPPPPPPPPMTRRPERQRRIWFHAAWISALVLVLVLSFGRCRLIQFLIHRFGALGSYLILIGACSPVVGLFLLQFLRDHLPRTWEQLRRGSLLLILAFIAAVFSSDLILLIIPNLICFLINLVRNIL